MKTSERLTLYVSFQHVQDYNCELADAIEMDFHYLEPFLRQALFNLMRREHEDYATDDEVLSEDRQRLPPGFDSRHVTCLPRGWTMIKYAEHPKEA